MKGLPITMICGAPALSLHGSEQLLCVLPGTTLSEPRSVRVYQSGYSGASVRVAKGFWLHGGGSTGISRGHDELQNIDQGDFVITNQRVAFIGAKRTASIPLNKIVGTHPYIDGLGVNKEGRDKAYVFTFDQNLTTTIEGETCTANGAFIQLIINVVGNLAGMAA
jgi:hypothetical protein